MTKRTKKAKKVKKTPRSSNITNSRFVVSGATLAKITNVSPRTVQRWAAEKNLPAVESGKYDLRDVWLWREGQFVEQDKNGADDYKRLLAAQADERQEKAKLAKIRRRVEEGKLIPLEEVEAGRLLRIVAAKTSLLNLQNTLTRRLTGISDPDEIGGIVQHEVYQCLTRFAGGKEIDVAEEIVREVMERCGCKRTKL